MPLLAVVVGLLASADPVFRRMIAPRFHAGVPVGHIALTVAFAFGTLMVGVAALGDHEPEAHRGTFDALQVMTMLGLAATRAADARRHRCS